MARKKWQFLQFPTDIEVAPRRGVDLEKAVKEAFEFAVLTGMRVILVFNGLPLPVIYDEEQIYPSQTLEEVYQQVLQRYTTQQTDPLLCTKVVALQPDEEVVKKDRTK